MNEIFSAARRLVLGSATALAASIALPAMAQEAYPSKPIRLVLPFAAGGGADVVTRIVAAEMSKQLGTTVLVENKGGAAGNIGMDVVAKAPKDGYTIVMMAQTAAANVSLYKNLPFDVEKEFAPIGLVGNYYMVLVVNAKSPIKSVSDLVATAKAKPGVLGSGTSGVGGAAYFATAQLMKITGIKIQHVAYKGIGPAMNDVLGGHLDMLFDIVATSEQFIKSGELRALGVTSATRSSVIPDVPPLSDTYPGLTQAGWLALAAPIGTPPDRVAKLNAALRASLRNPQVNARLTKLGYEISQEPSPAQLTQVVSRDIGFYRDLAKTMALEPQ